jgi:hypothetical protein
VKKSYLNRKRVYTHRYVAIPIPSKLHGLLQPFFGKDLQITIDAHANSLTITLTPKQEPAKPFLHDENTPAKTYENQAENHAGDDETENLLKYPPEETLTD